MWRCVIQADRCREKAFCVASDTSLPSHTIWQEVSLCYNQDDQAVHQLVSIGQKTASLSGAFTYHQVLLISETVELSHVFISPFNCFKQFVCCLVCIFLLFMLWSKKWLCFSVCSYGCVWNDLTRISSKQHV